MSPIIYGPWRWDGKHYVPGLGMLANTWSAESLTYSTTSLASWFLRAHRVPVMRVRQWY